MLISGAAARRLQLPLSRRRVASGYLSRQSPASTAAPAMLRLLAAYCLLVSCLLAATTLAKPQALLFHPSDFDQHPS